MLQNESLRSAVYFLKLLNRTGHDKLPIFFIITALYLAVQSFQTGVGGEILALAHQVFQNWRGRDQPYLQSRPQYSLKVRAKYGGALRQFHYQNNDQ